MKSHLFIPLLLCLAGPAAFSQQVTIKGQVSIHNSEYHNGKVQYIEGALVSAPFTTTTTTNNKGRFKLQFAGVDAGNSVAVSVEKAGLEVANPSALQGLSIGREAPLSVFLVKKEWLTQAQTTLAKSNTKALEAHHDKLTANLRQGGETSRVTLLELEKQLNRKITDRFEGEKLLAAQSETLKKQLSQTAEKLVRINLDLASAIYRQAFELYQQGEIEKAIATLDEEALEATAADALSNLREWERKGKTQRVGEEKVAVQQVVNSYWLKAQAHLLRFQYQSALHLQQKALSLLERAEKKDNIQLAEAYAAVARSNVLLENYKNALYYQQRNTKIKESLLGAQAPEVAAGQDFLAVIYRNLEQYQIALALQKKVIAVKEQALLTGHLDIASSYASLASTYHAMGAYGLALEAQQKALLIQEKALPPNHPEVARSYVILAAIHMDKDTYEPALKAQLDALFVQERALPAGHPDIIQSYNTLARIYLKLGEYAKAQAIQRQVVAMSEKARPAGHPDIAAAYHTLSSTFYFIEELDSALVYEHRAYIIYKTQLPLSHPQIKEVESSLAFLYSTRGDRLQTAGLYPSAIHDFKKVLEFRPDNADARKRIKQMQARQKNPSEALALRGAVEEKRTSAPKRNSSVNLRKEETGPTYFQVTQATSLRERPTSSSSVLRRLAAGDRMKVIEKTKQYWWKVLANGRIGYVKALLLKKM